MAISAVTPELAELLGLPAGESGDFALVLLVAGAGEALGLLEGDRGGAGDLLDDALAGGGEVRSVDISERRLGTLSADVPVAELLGDGEGIADDLDIGGLAMAHLGLERCGGTEHADQEGKEEQETLETHHLECS